MPEGGTPTERLDMAFRKVLTVPKSALLEREAAEKRAKELSKRTKPLASAPSLGGRASMRKPGL